MKKRGRLRKGLAILLSLAMVVGLMPGAGTIKVSAAEGEASGSVATAEGYDANGFCESGSFELTNGTWVLKNGVTECATHGGTCNGYQPANKTTGTYEVDGNNDTQDEVYEISNAGQLYWFADKINNENATYKNINAVLTKDITVNEGVLSDGKLNEEKVSTFRSWTPIGYYDSVAEIDYSFTGIFDGQGNTISGLYFSDSEKSYVGLFGESVGKIKRVNVNDSYYCGKDSVGAICGLIFNKGTIEDSNNINSFVSGTGKYVGGVCGRNYDGTITNCENTGNVSNVGYIGGICGANLGLVKNCRNSGNITGDDWVGGVCGSNSGSNGGKLETSYNTGDVKGVDYVGGVCGYQSGGSVDSCYNTGNVTGTSTDASVGGVCGYQSGLTNNCYSTGGVTCNAADTTVAYVGGVCGLQWGTIKNCYYDTGKFTGKAIHTSKTSSQTLYVEGKTPEQFSDGMVAYLLNSRSAEDSPVWYQNIDNELEKNKAPVLDSSHGTVYASKPCPVKCSNTESTVSAESQSHSFGDDNICTVCGAKGEIIDDPTLINDKPSNVDGVYQIKTVREFYYFVALVNGRLVGVNQDTSASAVLKTDITVNDNVLDEDGNLVSETGNLKTWVPIGYSDGVRVQTYTGTFDGGGHTISGLYFDDKSISYVGLFGSSTRTIKNVKVVDSYFKGDTYVGGICGKNEGNIEGCEASGKIEANNQYADIGGICGYNGAGHVKNCTAAVKVNTSLKYEKAGGICGENIGTIEKCNSKGEININGSAAYGGGICGTNNSTGVIKSCYNTGTVYCKENAGGICGSNNGEVADCYNTGSCKASTLSIYLGKAGGICGSSSGSITNCYSTGNVSGYYTGKLCGNNSSGVTNCYYQDSSESDSIAGTTFKEATQFASGEVAYLLNEGKSDSDVVWRQTINTDTAPVLDSTHSIVYASKPCESEFANTEITTEKKHTVTMSADGTSHTCSVCKKTEQHADVATFTVDDEKHSITATCPSDCDLGTITLSASDATYDGTAKVASTSGAIKGFDTPLIVYEKKGADDNFATINSTPTDAGTYRAGITYTVDEANNKVYSVSTEYTISPATPTIAWESSSKTVNYTGNAITEEKIGAPTVTLVNGESYKGAIQYSYRTSGSSDEFTSGLPTEIGTYEVKAVVDADGNYAKAEKSMTLTIAWLSDVADATLTDQGGKSLTGDDWWAQSVTFTPPEGYTICGTVDGTYDDFYTYSTETAEAGTDVIYYLKNKTTGELAQMSATVRVDTTAPDWSGANDGISIKTNKWKSMLSTISFGLFYKETVDVTVSASDSLSGVAKYYYYVDTLAGETVKTKEELDALANGEGGFTEYAVTNANAAQKITSLSADSSCVVYVYAVDKAGNKSDYICSNGVVIDKTAPTISDISTPSEGSGEDATLTDTKADMTFTASESGTYFYIVKKSSEGALTAIADFADSSVDENTGMTVWTANEGVTADAMTAGDSNRLSLTGLTANTEYTVYVVAVDKAGNISNILSQTFTTCKTMPKVTTNPTLSGTYGTAVSAMTLENGVAKAGDTVIDGTWTLTDANASDVSSVGTTNTYEVTFTPADTYNGQYETVKVSVKPTVERKAVTVTAENKSKTYGQENPKLTFTVPEGSLVGSDTEEALGVTLSCEATKTSPVQEGGYAITGTSSSANYDVEVKQGTLTIEKADATITVGTDTYNKTFGDAAFNLSDVTDTNTEANVQYEVATGTDVITVSNGTVTIVKAGNATITVSLPESTNYNAATPKTITVNVAKQSDYTVADINRSYLYSKDIAENIDFSKYLPSNCGTVTYGTPQVNGNLYTDDEQPQVSSDGKLSYTVKTGSVGTTGTIKVTVTTDNYEDFVLTVNVNLTDKIPVTLSGVTCGNRVYNGTVYAYTGTPVWKTEEGVTATGVTTVIYYKAGDFSAPVDAPTDAGNYWAEFTITSDEYVGTESYSFEITKAEITVAAKDRNIYIGDTVPDLTNPTVGTDYTVTGLCGTDALGGTAAMSYGREPDNTKAGTYEIRISGLTVPEGDNYTITFTNGTLTITTKPSGGGGSSSGGSIGGGGITGGSEVTTGKDSGSNVTTTTSPTEVKVENGTASATVKAANVTEAIKQAADNKSTQIVFTVSEKDTGNADNIRLTMTTSDVKQILDKTDADLVVATVAGDIILPQEALKEAVSAAGGNTITIEIDKVTTPTDVQKEAAGENSYIVEVTIMSQNKAITTFGGNTLRIRVEIPAALAGKNVAVIHIAEDGKTEKMSGKTITEGTKQYYEFTTTHLSTFALIEETEEGNQPSEPTEPETPSEPTVPTEPTKPEVTAPKTGTLLTHSKTKMVYKVSKSGTTGGTVQFVKTKNTKTKTVTIPDKVTIGGITYKVTSIATGALKNKKAITKVVIGKHVTKIGKKAFSGCSKLKVLKINSTKLTSGTLSGLSMKGISTRTVIKVPKSKVKAYKKLFVKKGLSKKVKVKSL